METNHITWMEHQDHEMFEIENLFEAMLNHREAGSFKCLRKPRKDGAGYEYFVYCAYIEPTLYLATEQARDQFVAYLNLNYL